MNKIINTKHQIAYNSLQLALALVDLDQKTRYYGTDVPIFYSEIHIIMAIAEHPGIHVGGLAEILGVTKGAVSEILKKLEKKDLIIKEIDNLNLSRYSLNLTEKGKKAHKNHMYYHSVLNNMVKAELQNASTPELEFLSTFLSSLSKKVKSFNENFDD